MPTTPGASPVAQGFVDPREPDVVLGDESQEVVGQMWEA
jgi:hypothetical protein